MSKGLKPKIRFKGFEDEWEYSSFSETFSPLKNNTLSRTCLTTSSYGVKNVHYGDVLIKFGSVINIGSDELPTIINDFVPELSSQVVLQNGDVIFADTAEDEAVGKCSEIQGINNDRIVSGLHTIPVRPNKSFGKFYLGNFLNSKSYHDTLKPFMQGIKVLSISKNAFSQTYISNPKLKSEQSSIGEFFSTIDGLIKHTEREIGRLEKMKQASLQKMFPRPGTTTPEIRFSGFSEPWEETMIKDIAEITTGKSNTQDQIAEGRYPFFIRSDKPVRSNKFLFDCEAVITIGDGQIGKVFHYYNGKFDLHQRCYLIFNFINIDARYFFYYFSTFFYERAMKLTAKATVDSVRMEMISDMLIKYPENMLEQKAIGEYFRNLDSVISSKRQKLAKLRQIKQACLDKMFVNATEL